MSKGVVLFADAGKVPPKELVEKLVKSADGYGGVAFVDNALQVFCEGSKPEINDIMDNFEAMEDNKVLMYFGKYPDGVLTNDLQPFVVISDGESKEPAIAVILDGDFSPSSQAGSTHTPAYHASCAVTEILQQLFQETEEDEAKFKAKLHSPLVKNALTNLAISPESIVIMAMVGDQMYDFSKHGAGRTEFEWGWVTDKLDYSEAKKDEKPASRFANWGKKKEPVAVENATVPENKKPSNKEELNNGTKAPENGVFAAPPKTLSNGEKTQWYNKYAENGRPQGYKQTPAVLIKKEYWSLFQKDQQIADLASKLPPKEESPKDEGPVSLVPIIPPDAKAKLAKGFEEKGDIPKLINAHGKEMPSLEEIENVEKKRLTFLTQTPAVQSMDEIENWPREVFHWIGGQSLISLSTLAFDLAQERRAMRAKLPKQEETKKEEEKPVSRFANWGKKAS